jgi:exopolyphosphatase / guanosine-5'-triphosphate,3'-diphosphate pyrophosphatase
MFKGVEALKGKYGIVDIGSNTIRLVIYQQDKSGRLKEIENVKAVARLRNFLLENGELSEDGIKVLIDTLKSFQEVTRFHQLRNVKCVATATIRQAINQKEIIQIVQKETDFQIRILSEYEEAYYGFLAVVNSTSIHDGFTIDIGGGSTEITYFQNRNLKHFHSFPFGVLSLKKQFVKGNTPTETELKALKQFLQKQFAKLPWLKGKKLPIIAIGGSARNLVQMDQARKQYPLKNLHQYQMDLKDIVNVKNYLTSLSFDKLKQVEGLSKDRADIIIPAIEVFLQLYETVEATAFILSRKGLRDGIFYEELLKDIGSPIFTNVVEESFQQLAIDYEVDLKHAFQVTNIVYMLFRQLKDQQIGEWTDVDVQLLRTGALFYNLGQYIDPESSSQHTFYLLANRTIDGMFHKEQVELALIASFKNSSLFKQYVEPFQQWFSKEEQRKLRFLGALIKFAYHLNATKRDIVENIHVKVDEKGTIHVNIYCNQNWQPEQYQVEKQKKHLIKVLKREVKLHFLPINTKMMQLI